MFRTSLEKCNTNHCHQAASSIVKSREIFGRGAITTTQQDKFTESVITGDKTWYFEYDPETKLKSENDAHRFFDYQSVVHKEFVPPGKTVNAQFYVEVLERLRKRVLRVRPAMSNTWKLHHDNAPCHTALLVREWQAKHNLVTLPHPPYSPDLAPPDFFLFPRLKRQMKGRRFDTIEAVQEAITRGLRSIPVENFQPAYADWQTRYTKCINSGGCYFEEY
ncbi:Mariner Mos1 transposase [Anthophora retusa]